MRLRHLAAATAMLAFGLAARADSVYSINQNVGDATAVGTVTTDGALGTLTAADILGYNLTLSRAGTTPVTVSTSATGFGFTGSDLSATTEGLFFNFSGTDAGEITLGNDNFAAYICLATGSTSCGAPDGRQTRAGVQIYIVPSSTERAPFSGIVQVASVASVASTPEPSSLALLGTGVLGLIGAARRRLS